MAARALWLAWWVLATGCASVPRYPDPGWERAVEEGCRHLVDSLQALGPAVDREEAERLAACAYDRSRELAWSYRAVRPAVCQNVLVNFGLRERGLCYHWAEDLNQSLGALELRTLRVIWAVARPGTWREHNSLVVLAAGQPFEEGIVLDAWRDAGRLYWGRVGADRYPWQLGTNALTAIGPPQ